MVQLGVGLPTAIATPSNNVAPTKPDPTKSISIDKFFEVAKNNGIDKLPPDESNKQMDRLVETIRKSGGDVIGWNNFKTSHEGFSNIQPQDEGMSTLGKIGVGAGIGAGAAAAGYAIGKPSQLLGEFVYSTAFGDTASSTSKQIRSKEARSISQTAMETPGVYGTELRIGQKAYQGQQKIWKEQIAPYIKKTIPVTTVDELGSDIVKNIKKGSFSAAKKKELLEEVNSFIVGLRKSYPNGVINQSEAHLLTSEWGKDLEAVFKKVGKDVAATPITNEAKGIILEGRGILRNKLIKSIADRYSGMGVSEEKIVKALTDYGNLGKVVSQSEKDLQQRLLGSVLGASSAVLKKGGTPLATVGGKGLATFGKALAAPAEKTAELIGKGVKFLGKAGKTVLADTAGIIAPDLLEVSRETKKKVSETLPKYLKEKGVNIPE